MVNPRNHPRTNLHFKVVIACLCYYREVFLSSTFSTFYSTLASFSLDVPLTNEGAQDTRVKDETL